MRWKKQRNGNKNSIIVHTYLTQTQTTTWYDNSFMIWSTRNEKTIGQKQKESTTKIKEMK